VIPQASAESSAPSTLAWLRGLGSALVDLLFPRYCVACRRYGTWLCADCLRRIEVIHPPVCLRCGMPLDAPSSTHYPESAAASLAGSGQVRDVVLLCSNCRDAPPRLSGLRACAFHSGPLRTAIHQFKYNDLQCLAAPFGEMMSQGWSLLAPGGAVADLLVPVPLHRTRQRARGYNQAALLAEELGGRLGLPVKADVLIRTKATAPQVGLRTDERRANVHGAFACVDGSLAGTRVLLVDDVYTTGSTLEAASAALQQGGVESVWAYTLARAS
jgi:ComF family protein